MKFTHIPPVLRHGFAVIALGGLLFLPGILCAQHVHINAGASNTTQNAALYFPNGSTYNTNAGYDVYLSFTNNGPFSGLFQGAGVSFTALASTSDNGGPTFGHAAEGAFLQLQLVSLSGPSGGIFGVWTQEVGNPTVSYPLFSLSAGETKGTNLLALSENDGAQGSDPYGHIHGRTFTATEPGLYTLGCRLLDTSRNGAGGGPIHTPSAIYYLYFQAGLTISSFVKSANSSAVTFGTTAGRSYYVESAPDLLLTNWTTFAGPFAGDNKLRTVTTNSNAPRLFFRLRTN